MRRILASGACVACQAGIQPGDRLVSLNTTRLHGLSHTACVDVLSRPVTKVCLTLLRHQPTDRHSDTDTSSTSGGSDTSSDLTSDGEKQMGETGRGSRDWMPGVSLGTSGDASFGDMNSTLGGRSSGDAQFTSGDISRMRSVDECSIDDTADVRRRHKSSTSKVLTPLARGRRTEQTYNVTPILVELAHDDVSTRDSCEMASFTIANSDSEVPSNSDSSAPYWPAAEQQLTLHGNRLFAQHGPFIYPWRQEFEVLQHSLVDGDTASCSAESHVIAGEDGSDLDRRSEIEDGTDLMMVERSHVLPVDVLPVIEPADSTTTHVANVENTHMAQVRDDPAIHSEHDPDVDSILPAEYVQSDMSAVVTERCNSYSETCALRRPPHGDRDYVNVQHLLTSRGMETVQPELSCTTSSMYGDSTFDDSYACGDSLTPGQVRDLLTSPFEELEREFDQDSTSESTCSKNTILSQRDIAERDDDYNDDKSEDGTFSQAHLSTEDTRCIHTSITSSTSDVTDASSEGDSSSQYHQQPQMTEPNVDMTQEEDSGTPPVGEGTRPQSEDLPTGMDPRPPGFVAKRGAVDLCKDPDMTVTPTTDMSPSVAPVSPDTRRKLQHMKLMAELKVAAQEVCYISLFILFI